MQAFEKEVNDMLEKCGNGLWDIYEVQGKQIREIRRC